jgi:hypothetical protein
MGPCDHSSRSGPGGSFGACRGTLGRAVLEVHGDYEFGECGDLGSVLRGGRERAPFRIVSGRVPGSDSASCYRDASQPHPSDELSASIHPIGESSQYTQGRNAQKKNAFIQDSCALYLLRSRGPEAHDALRE